MVSTPLADKRDDVGAPATGEGEFRKGRMPELREQPPHSALDLKRDGRLPAIGRGAQDPGRTATAGYARRSIYGSNRACPPDYAPIGATARFVAPAGGQ